ncbi:MAG TPA: type II secretion system F family protein [Xanthobacteraceae bacterium]|jgi:tight adherence protein C|nr:type II secretion system F family protein [Xanthobacteraceae bacterium]
MDTSSTLSMFGDSAATMLSVMIFLAAGTVAFAVMLAVRAREAVRRRAAGVSLDDEGTSGRRSMRSSGLKAAQRLVDYTTRHYSEADSKDVKVLRRRLIAAGIYDPHGAAYFFIARVTLAIGLAAAVYLGVPMLGFEAKTSFWLFLMCGGVLGYLLPSFYLDRRIAARRLEHQAGFPDFMDLLVVCADAGLSMEAALDRVGRELGVSYPSLAANIHMANLEIRAGRTMTEALEHLGDRLGLDEARSFATLIAQSEELGSSIGDALRVYSDDMRHKRLSRAEEKAYSLPAKLAIPMMVCIFPVLFIVILCPVIVRLSTGNW